jgi:hypothetical protein
MSYMATKAYSTRNALLREAPRSAATWPPPWLTPSQTLVETVTADLPAADKHDFSHDSVTIATRPAELATWPLALRERWGVHAAELEILGTPFPESERKAFEFLKSRAGRI